MFASRASWSDEDKYAACELSEAMIGDTCSPFDWMAYPRFDPAQRGEAPPEPVEIDVETEVLESYAGDYRMTDGRTLSVRLEGGRLVVSTDAVDWVPLLAETRTRFFMENEDQRFTFVANDAGSVTHLEIGIEGLAMRLERIGE